MRRRWKLILFAVVLPLVLLGGCGAVIAKRLQPKPKEAKTAKVEQGDVVVSVRETGTVEPIKRVEVKSKVAGKIVELAVDAGDTVEEGQLIARLDVPETEAQRDQVKAQLAGARAGLEQARLSLAQSRETVESQVQQAQANLRATRGAVRQADTSRRDAERVYQNKRRLLDMGGYVSQNDVDSAKAALDLAADQFLSAEEGVRQQEAALAMAESRRTDVEMGESRVVGARASLQQVQDSLIEIESRVRDAVIRAPCSGVVIGRHFREGEIVTAVSYYGAGEPIVTIGDLSTMLVKVDLNEVDVAKVHLGLPVKITADALPRADYTGTVTRISPASLPPAAAYGQSASPTVRFPIEVTVSGSPAELKTGMTANVEIVCDEEKDVLWVPNDALFEKDDKWQVSVVTGKDKTEERVTKTPILGRLFRSRDRSKGKLSTKDREVTMGLASDTRTEIRSGLKKGEEVELGKSGVPERKTIDIRRQSKGEADEE